jgi:predicted nucleotidyltransferase
MDNAHKLINAFTNWANNEDNIQAIGLVGSYARDAARPDSDIDLMIIVKDQDQYINDEGWVHQFGEVDEIEDEIWSQLKTKRVYYKDGLEVEYNFDKKSWANPQDSGTKRVVTDGMKILVDKEGILKELVAAFAR